MRIESSVELQDQLVDHPARCAGQRGEQAQSQAMAGGEVRTLSELLGRIQAFHAATLGSAAVCTGKMSVQQMRSPLPYRLSLTIEKSGNAVRLRETVEVAALPAPGGPAAVRAIEQQIEHNLRSWQRQAPPQPGEWNSPSDNTKRPQPLGRLGRRSARP